MNKIKKTFDNIKLSDKDKEMIYENIMGENKKTKKAFNFGKVLRFAAIVVVVGIFSLGSVYAMARIFNWNNDFLRFLHFSEEEAEVNNFENSEINKTLKIDGAIIEIKQATIFSDNTYLLLNVNFDEASDELDSDNFTFDLTHSISIKTSEDEYFGSIEPLNVSSDNKTAIMIASINTENKLKLGDKVQILVGYNYSEVITDDGTTIGSCKDFSSIDWAVDINGNNDKIDYKFNDKIYVKDTSVIKIYPTSITITPIGINLDIILETEFKDYSDEDLIRFDKDIVINFKDGKTIKLNSVSDDDTFVHGSNIVGYEDGVKSMSLKWESIYTSNNYTKYEFNLLDLNKIKNIAIGNKIIYINK